MSAVTEAARARAARLLQDWGWPDPIVLEDILALGEEAVPALAELLTPERLVAAQTDDYADAVVYFALELLAALGLPAAIPVFLTAYRQVDDDMVENLEHTLQRLGPEASEPLLEIVADPSLSWYARALAANAAVYEAQRNSDVRQRVTDGLRSILAGYVERLDLLTASERDMVASLSIDLARLADPQARPLIDLALAAECMQTREEDALRISMIDTRDVEYLYQDAGSRTLWTPPPYLEDYREQWQKYQAEEQKNARAKLLDQTASPQPIVLIPRLGRNDPCWCGSGQKYKKCHLAQDEKNKVRL